jgi:O-phosphoseryl-tRNA(Cys) synthetase
MPQNFMRHYYDIYHLLNLKEVKEFIGTEYVAYKKERFGGDDTKISNSDAFKLNNLNDLRIFETAYTETQTLYYQGQINLREIISFINTHLNEL